MSSVVDIRPSVVPLSVPVALANAGSYSVCDALGNPFGDPSVLTITGITVSSNDCEEGWAFVAIPGLTQHGVRFAHAAAEAGAALLITDSEGAKRAIDEKVGLPIVVLKDPRRCAATIAATLYGQPATKLKTMAVTGTNGKTTTSFLMRAALGVEFPNPSICGTVETRIGNLRFRSDQTTAESPVIQRFLAQTLEEGLGAAVIETSSHALSFERVDDIVFDVVGFTNLQHDHLDYHGDMENYFAAKKSLFTQEHSRRGVVCVDDEWGQRLAREAEVPVTTVAALSSNEAEWHIENTHPDRSIGRTVFTLVDPNGAGHDVAMPILGEVNVQNTAVAIVAAVQLGYDVDAVIAAIEKAEQIPGRMEMINPKPHNQPLVIVDYAHTPEALEWTLRSTAELTKGKLHIVFGTDGDRDASKREYLAEIAAREADVLWVTDENPRTEDPQSIRDYLLRGITSIRPDMHDVTEIKTCRRDAVRKAILAAQPGDTVIITGKGSEWYQDFEGIKHEYNDVPVSREVLYYDVRSHI